MHYEPELMLLRETLRKCRLQTLITELSSPLAERRELLHPFLQERIPDGFTVCDAFPQVRDGVMYRLRDSFGQHFIVTALPELGNPAALIIGPYLTQFPSDRVLMEIAEKNGVLPSMQKQLRKTYEGIPVLTDGNHLFALLEAFGERLWGAGSFLIEEVNHAAPVIHDILQEPPTVSETDIVWNMRSMEQRYAYENELMDAVSRGQSHKVDLLLNSFSAFSFEQRLANPLRNAKNYSIIMNTLLRKSAERGGVHPVYLDKVSSDFASRIEQLDALDGVLPLMQRMFHSYCMLVRKHSMKDYSPPVQKAIACIDADLAGDLSLSNLSAALNISGSYLSTLFKKEMGQTLTEFINRRRIDHAKHLLRATRLQIQTVAQHCGIMDVHYFSKVFRKHTGLSPKQYREGQK